MATTERKALFFTGDYFDESSSSADSSEKEPNFIDVKFGLQKNLIFTQQFDDRATIQVVKEHLYELLNLEQSTNLTSPSQIDLHHDDVRSEDNQKLNEFSMNFNRTALYFRITTKRLTIDDVDGDNNVDDDEQIYGGISLLDEDYIVHKLSSVTNLISVELDRQQESCSSPALVEVANRTIVKPYLGGYRNRISGQEYHHGYSQTGPRKPKVPPEEQNHRNSQTYFYRNRLTEVSVTHHTQMSNEEIWISPILDRIVEPKPYETAEEREKRIDIEGKVRIIQRYYRMWKLRQKIREYSEEYRKRMRLECERETYELNKDYERKKRDLVSILYPYSDSDFQVMYSMTATWKANEVTRINQEHFGASKRAEIYLLLEKEIVLLRSIEQLRRKLRDDRQLQKDIKFFRMIGEPVRWRSTYKNFDIEMDTLETQKGRVFYQMYAAVCDITASKSERITVLLKLRASLINHNGNCETANDLVALIDRACELLAKDFNAKYLETLQKRIETLLLHHYKTSECNEGVTNRERNRIEAEMRKGTHFCKSCRQLKTTGEFPIHVRLHQVRMCKQCCQVDKSNEPWLDLSPYRFLLKQIRRQETIQKSPSSICFILQERDIYRLVTYIWHSHSSLSECDDIYQLTLCRWRKMEVWSPWNCIFLTNEEAKAHLTIQNLETVYSPDFIQHIRNKHELARKLYAKWLKIIEQNL